VSALAFTLTPANEATAPAAERDEVRLLVARHDRPLMHDMFRGLPSHLRAGDLLVVNTSATIPAALSAGDVEVHLSTPLPAAGGGRAVVAAQAAPSGAPRATASPAAAPNGLGRPRWVVELRRNGARFRGGHAGDRLDLPGGATAELIAPYLSPGRLWIAALDVPAPLLDYLAEHGRPIAYAHLTHPRPLEDLQTIFADEPGSAEMPSAGRPFSQRVLDDLLARGVQVAPLLLHTGVSSLELGERPYPERYRVPALTATRVNAHRAAGGRVIAIGTTVVRALETVAAPDGTVEPGEGWTGLTITPERGVRAVDGLLTGWHEPDASHLLMLEAVGGRELIERSYAAALSAGYRWHEFGDTHLILR
jgi:S-adenosylmethionine:tRNA ribosyltransferase-isomerase